MSPIRMSKPEEAIRVVLEFSELFNRHDAEGLRLLLGEECVLEASDPAPDGGIFRGRKAVKPSIVIRNLNVKLLSCRSLKSYL